MADVALFYDGLPRIVREALNNTVQKIKCVDCRLALDAGWSPEKLAGFIRDLDTNYVTETTILDIVPNVRPLERRDNHKGRIFK